MQSVGAAGFGIAPAIIALLASGACLGTTSSDPSPPPSPATSERDVRPSWILEPAEWRLAYDEDARPSDRTLDIEVLGGGCHWNKERVHHVEVEEDDRTVRITAYITEPRTTPGQMCEMPVVLRRTTVTLQEPLGDRDLIDTACLEETPPASCRRPERRPG